MKTIVFLGLMGAASFVFSAGNLGIISGWDVLASHSISRSAEGKKGMVVVFLSAKCPCSDSHVGEIKKLSEDYPDFSFVAVNSNQDESDEMVKKYFKSAEFSFPVLKDKKAELADRYSALKTPHSFVMDPQGKILYQGGVSSSRLFAKADHKYLREALADIHDGKPVSIPEGRTLGCAITRGEPNAW